jgi:hypothetical protein
MAESKKVTVEVTLVEDSATTEANAALKLGNREVSGTGVARRNPVDPNVPLIGEELATARALSDLAHGLVEAAATEIESFTGEPAHLSE